MDTTKVFKEEDVELVAKNILSKLSDKIKEDIADKLYTEYEAFLYEHYTNVKDRIEDDLIADIAKDYKAEPQLFKYRKIRDKMWQDNKAFLVELLTEEAIKESVENIILQYTHKTAYFSWRWKDGIANFILDNWGVFNEDERINSTFIRKIAQQQDYISALQKEVDMLRKGEEQ